MPLWHHLSICKVCLSLKYLPILPDVILKMTAPLFTKWLTFWWLLLTASFPDMPRSQIYFLSPWLSKQPISSLCIIVVWGCYFYLPLIRQYLWTALFAPHSAVRAFSACWQPGEKQPPPPGWLNICLCSTVALPLMPTDGRPSRSPEPHNPKGQATNTTYLIT